MEVQSTQGRASGSNFILKNGDDGLVTWQNVVDDDKVSFLLYQGDPNGYGPFAVTNCAISKAQVRELIDHLQELVEGSAS